MAIDFRANQIRTNKIISSGSTGTGANILFYDFAAASNGSGGINASIFSTSSIGTDFFVFFSGSIGSIGTGTSHGVAGFGGDVYISGNLYLAGTSNISATAAGSADISASYLVISNTASLPNERAIGAGPGITFTDGGANGSFAISASLIAGPNITINQVGNALAISGTIGSGSGIIEASYVVDQLEFSPVDYVMSGATAPVTSTGNYTLAAAFAVTEPRYIIGVRFYAAAATTYDCYLWDAGGQRLAHGQLTASSPEIYSVLFSSSHYVTASGCYETLKVSYRNTSASTFAYITSTADAPALVSMIGPAVELMSYGMYAAGDAYPNSSAGYSYIVEPIIGTVTQSITGTFTGVAGADISASYLVISNTASLPSERAIAAGNGIRFADGGANSTFTISDALWLESGSGNLRTTSSVAIGTTTFATGSGRDVFLFVSGAISGANSSTSSIAVFGGDVVISGNLYTSSSVKQRTRISVGRYTTTTASISAPLVAGQFYFDPSEHFKNSVVLRTILSVAGTTTASVALYNISTAKYVHIGGAGITALSSSNLTPELKQSVNLNGASNWDNTPAIYEVQLYSSSSTLLSILGGAEIITL